MAPIPRPLPQIVARIKELEATKPPFYNAEASALLNALPFEVAAEFLAPAVWVEATWSKRPEAVTTAERVRSTIEDHLVFAWGSANGCKGTAVAKYLAAIRGLVWLLGEPLDETYAKLSEPMTYFGKPALVVASALVSFDWRHADNDEWVNAPGDDPISAAAAGH